MNNKTENATPYKLQKAKEKGQVSKSIELNSTFFLLVMTFTTAAFYPSLFTQIKALMIHLLYLASSISLTSDNVIKLHQFILAKLVSLWLPFAFAAALSLLVSTLSQTGFIWTMHPLIPDMKRLNLVQGIKRFFSSKILFEFAKNGLKLGLAFSLIGFSLLCELPFLVKLIVITPLKQSSFIIHLFFKLTAQTLILLFSLAIIDKFYINWRYKKENRMSKQEVSDEYRQREGDPKIKAKIQQLQQQLRRKAIALEQVKTADVIITNPTHLAIALQYKQGIMPAPKVVCKAQGEFANRVMILAQRHNIPTIQSKAFARALFATTEVNQWISQEHFPVAAEIFREVYRQREPASC